MTKRKKIVLACVNAALLALIGVCVWQCRNYETVLTSQQTAKSWAGESTERFAQVSCFFPKGTSVTPDAVNTFRRTIDGKLSEAGLEQKKKKGGYWTDAYAALGTLTVQSDRESSDATMVAIGGDFFAFHPYRLLSGSYLNPDDLMQDRVVIDHELAWKLFGGTDLKGQTVKINGKPYYVAGVIERESDKFTQRALNGQESAGSEAQKKTGTPPLLFMSYTAYAGLGSGSTGPTVPTGGDTAAASGKLAPAGASAADTADSGSLASGDSAALSCYEIAMPNPISKFAANIVSEGFKANSPVIVENSARYDFMSIWSMFKNLGRRSVVTSPVIFPYWENAARVSEVYVARQYVFILLLSIFPLVTLVWLCVLFIRWLMAKVRRLCFSIWDAWDDRYGRRRMREKRRAERETIQKQIESGELPPETLPAPETAEEKLEAFINRTKQGAQTAGGKTRTLFSRRSEKKSKLRPAKKLLSTHWEKAGNHAQPPSPEERAEPLFSSAEQLDLERIVQEVLDENEKQNK